MRSKVRSLQLLLAVDSLRGMWRSHKTNSDETRADGNHDNTVLNVLWFTTVYYGILWLAMGLQYSTIVYSGVVYFTMVTMVT